MLHIAVAEMLVDRLSVAPREKPAHGRIARASLAACVVIRRGAALLLGRERAEPALSAQVERLAALSPHLLLDAGIDPATGFPMDDTPSPGLPAPAPLAAADERLDRAQDGPLRPAARRHPGQPAQPAHPPRREQAPARRQA